MKFSDMQIAIIGLGYVGLPLAVEFGRKRSVVGFDTNKTRIKKLKEGIDHTLETTYQELKDSVHLSFTSNLEDIKKCKIFIVTVPTPIDEYKKPDLSPLKNASEAIGYILKKGDIVIYESTVYPGATEELCVPILEELSEFKLNKDFYVGYSPERINPGDMERRIENITKVVSASNDFSLEWTDFIYSKIVKAGTYRASSIRVAEAAKVIENIQRDLNIGLANELSIIFDKIGIDTDEVLNAAATKWNFNKYTPGLVGGHCIGVDPYYLTHKSIDLGYVPELILSARKINENVSSRIAHKAKNMMSEKNIVLDNAKVLILGATFKENCPDIRNSKVFDLEKNLTLMGLSVDVFDPIANFSDNVIGKINLVNTLSTDYYDLIIWAVPHKEIVSGGIKEIKRALKKDSIFCDLKSYFNVEDSNFRL